VAMWDAAEGRCEQCQGGDDHQSTPCLCSYVMPVAGPRWGEQVVGRSEPYLQENRWGLR
jgi:hypothetical protein